MTHSRPETKSGREHDADARAAKQLGDDRKKHVEPELCVEDGLGLHRQRLRYPKSLTLKRNGGGGHIVHRAEDAHAECEQGGKKAVGKSEHFEISI